MLLTTSNALGFPLLSLIVFLPLVGAGCRAAAQAPDGLIHATALFIAGLDLVLALVPGSFDRGWADPATQSIQYGMRLGAGFSVRRPRAPAPELAAARRHQLPAGGGRHLRRVGAPDRPAGLSALLFSSPHVGHRVREYGIWMLILQIGPLRLHRPGPLPLLRVLGSPLIPMIFLIAIWVAVSASTPPSSSGFATPWRIAPMLVALVAPVS
ncbi:MAG: hypothetical protein IPL60_09630 [Ardenticatenia bacterium]|nr:hypothetical protein [Ardenticatenia bacterium]